MSSRTRLLPLAALVALGVSACGGGPQGPRIRFAHATPAQLAAAEGEQVVWYEFKAGDQVPMVFALRGIVEAEAPAPVMLRATRDFWVVVYQDGRQYFSFDGERLYMGELGKFGLFLTSTQDGPATGVMLFIGQRQDMPPELR